MPARRHHHGHDAAGHERARRHRIHHGALPDADPVVSASINRGELFKIYDALAAGAVDVLEKPTGDEADGVWERRFLVDA